MVQECFLFQGEGFLFLFLKPIRKAERRGTPLFFFFVPLRCGFEDVAKEKRKKKVPVDYEQLALVGC